MKAYTASVVLAFCITLPGCSDGHDRVASRKSDGERFVRRLTGCAEVVNGLVYVMGGISTSALPSVVGAYDPTTKTWTSKAPIPTPRSGAASAVIGSTIYIAGGRNEKGVLSTLEAYNTTEDRWVSCSNMPTARWLLMLCAVEDKLYAFGGIAGTGGNRRTLDVVEVYDSKSESWQFFGHMPDRRHGAAVATIDRVVYVISGKVAAWPEATAGETITRRADSFDPKTKTWTRLQDIPTGRVGAGAVVVSGAVLLVGGYAPGGDLPTTTCAYEPRSNQWNVGPRLTKGRSGHMWALVNDSVLVLGGSATVYGTGEISILGTIETLDLSEYNKE